MRGLSGIILGACLVAAPAASAQYVRNDVDCSGLKLVAASGVPNGDTHSYKFHGFCTITQTTVVAGDIAGFEYEKENNVKILGTVWTDVAASWNSQTGYFKEQAKTQGTYAGEVAMELRCTADPVLWNAGTFVKPPCLGLAYSNTTGWNGFDRVYAVPRPISQSKTTVTAATTLSQQQASSTPSSPPSPPPAPTPTSTSPTIPRVTMPAGIEPVVAVSPQIAVAPTRTVTTPVPPPPSESSGEITLAPAVQVELQDGRTIVADGTKGALHWTIVGPKGQLMRRFPAGSKLTEDTHQDLTLNWAGGSYRAGQRRAEKSKEKAHHH